MWPDDLLWKFLSGDSGNSGNNGSTDTYQRVEETYRNRQQHPSEAAYDEWSNAVDAYDRENQQLFGAASTCAELSDNVEAWLEDRDYGVQLLQDRQGKHVGYFVYDSSSPDRKLTCNSLDDLLKFARGIAKAEGLL